MTVQEALKMIREICEAVQITKKQHDTLQCALELVENKCLEIK